MTETTKRDKQLNWLCRVLIIGDIAVILSGYFSWFQTKNQLISRLIPKRIIYEIFSDDGDMRFKISIIAAVIFLAGLLLYSFRKMLFAIILFSTVIIFFFFHEFLLKM